MTQLTQIEIYNLPKSVSEEVLRDTVSRVFEAFCLSNTKSLLEINFVTPSRMAEINKKYRGVSGSTDVLSFPQADLDFPNRIFGTIIISEQDALLRAEDTNDLVKHGLLHLLGYDHDKDNLAWNKASKKINHTMGI